MKKLHTAEETINKVRRQPTEWEKLFASHVSDKWLISKTYKEVIQLNNKKQTIRFQNGQSKYRHFFQIANRYIRGCSTVHFKIY